MEVRVVGGCHFWLWACKQEDCRMLVQSFRCHCCPQALIRKQAHARLFFCAGVGSAQAVSGTRSGDRSLPWPCFVDFLSAAAAHMFFPTLRLFPLGTQGMC